MSSRSLVEHIKIWGRNRPQYVVIHFTGGTSDTAAGQLFTYKSYLRDGSNAHYLVGAAGIWEMVNPKLFYCTCSVGSSCGKKNECKMPGWGPSTFRGKLCMSHAGVVGHQNSISVEICSGKKGRKISDPMDDGWYFSDHNYKLAVELVAWICDEWSIKTDHIVMHNQVTGKLCPAMWCNSTGAEQGFFKFREDVAYKMNELDRPIESPTPEPDKTGTVQVAKGAYFYARPLTSSARVGQATSDTSIEYSFEQNGFYCTEQGWVQK